jgi:large subunit ribosomal protein L6
MVITLADGVLRVGRPSEERRHKALHGLTRALLNNMVMGVTQGYERALELVGTGYRAQQAGKKVVLQVGYSHPVEVETPPGITITVQSPIRLVVSGCDKQQVGQMAAMIRAIKPPDHYKGKGVRYAGEVVHLKPGKAAARKQQ